MAKIFLSIPRGEGEGGVSSSLSDDCLIGISEAPAVCKYETNGFPEIATKAHALVSTKIHMAS